ncbi:MAG: CoA transferase, partial [Dehalococcoidia bacterium]|nr:CoA transferase [Dehalococcoidia bacterium]
MTEVLGGIKVIDLSEEISGPLCSMYLGDMGAEVIKIESLQGDWARHIGPRVKSESNLFICHNRNKKSIAVDLTKPEGRQIVYDLVKGASVFI